MSKITHAQDQLLVVDPAALSPLEIQMPHWDQEDQLSSADAEMPVLEVKDEVPNIEIVIDDLPGAPAGTPDPEPMLEVQEPKLQVEELDDNDAKKGKNDKWDWASKGPHGFIAWVQEKIKGVPKHSGYDSAGLERAVAFMEKLDSEISKAMRMDLDGELDANKIEEVRAKLDDGIARLQNRLDKVKESKKSSRKRKKSAEIDPELSKSFSPQDINEWTDKTGVPGEEWTQEKAIEQMAEYYSNRGMVKEAQKVLGVKGIYIMAPLLIASIARICVNGTVSAGHDIEDLYSRQVKQWKLSDREQFELRNLLFDMGFPMRLDRGAIPEEEYDTASSNNMDWAANFKG